MSHNPDIIHLTASDGHTLARQVAEHLKNGWVVVGPVKSMRPINDLSTTVLMQLMVRHG